MSFLDLAAHRQSVRAYQSTPVEHDKLARCIEAARIAPSSCNGQPWRFVVVDEPQLKARIAAQTTLPAHGLNRFVVSAPALVLVTLERLSRSSRFGAFVRGIPFHYVDIGCAVEHFCLQATEEGLGTCILGWVKARGIRKLLRIPRARKVVVGIAVGYPLKDEVREKKRKEFDQVATWNRY